MSRAAARAARPFERLRRDIARHRREGERVGDDTAWSRRTCRCAPARRRTWRGVGIVDDHIGVGVVGDDLFGLRIEGRLRRDRTPPAPGPCRPWPARRRRSPWPGLRHRARCDRRSRAACRSAPPSLSATAAASAQACRLSGGTVRKIVPSSLIVRRRMLVPTGQMVTFFWMVRPLAMAIDSGVIDGPIRRDAPLIDQRARRRKRRLRIALHVGADVLGLDRHAGRGRGLVGVVDGDA